MLSETFFSLPLLKTKFPGAHLEGPFISADKRGCHPEQLVITSFGSNPAETIEKVYGSTKNIAIVTMAPELEGAQEAIKYLVAAGTTVSVGHSSAKLGPGEMAVTSGAKMITHLFNAMQSVSFPCFGKK